jgi:hypothetical protein
MKQSFVRILIILSLLVSSIAFLISCIAYYSTNWKSIEIPSRLSSININAEHRSSLDPLIRSELEKYFDRLYRPGISHLDREIQVELSLVHHIEHLS